jgi:methionyl-tRNA formyltransferase
MKNILCVGYRDWVLNIYEKITQNYSGGDVNIIASHDEYSDSLVIELNPDLILFYGWSWMISKDIIDKYKCIMLHPSSLPKYRGGSPIQNQIIRGEKDSAVTLFLMNEQMDAGPIIFQEPMSLSGSIDDIFNRIVELGYKGTMQFLDNPIEGVKQVEEDATYFERRTEEQSEITLKELKERSSEYIYNKVRMLQDPYPNAFFKTYDGNKIVFKDIRILRLDVK